MTSSDHGQRHWFTGRTRVKVDVAVTHLSFKALHVATTVEDFTESFRVYGVYFQAGDPESDGQAWNFTRSFDDDDGVCTVREIQQATFYDGIQRLRLERDRLICEFESSVVPQTECTTLEIAFDLEDPLWPGLVAMMDKICSGKTFYSVGHAP